MKNLLFLLFLLIGGFANGQDKIHLYNGKVLKGKIHEVDTNNIYYKYLSKKGEWKVDYTSKYRVFSFVKDQEETVLYKQDTSVGDYRTVQDLRLFIQGEKDAFNGANSRTASLLGFVVGAGAGFYIGNNNMMVVGVPLAYTAISLIPRVRIKKETVKELSYLENEAYIDGYVREAKIRRSFGALKGSAIGLAVGIISNLIFNPEF